MRILIASVFLAAIGATIVWLFWQTELKYTQPTPVPEGYREIYVNEKVYVGDTTSPRLEKPVFYHFFTTNCPCSRFNLKHFNQLKRTFEDRMDFYVVVPAEDDLEEARAYFEGETKIIQDINKEFAIKTGVYSTPQAVIITEDRKLYFRGNYNKARYCTDPLSNYAQMALDSLWQSAPPPDFGPLANIAYGCGIETNYYSLYD